MANIWTDSENSSIVQDYLVMLEHEERGRAFN